MLVHTDDMLKLRFASAHEAITFASDYYQQTGTSVSIVAPRGRNYLRVIESWRLNSEQFMSVRVLETIRKM
jgi:hypothetical protein